LCHTDKSGTLCTTGRRHLAVACTFCTTRPAGAAPALKLLHPRHTSRRPTCRRARTARVRADDGHFRTNSAYTCATCHASTATAVKGAIASGDTACETCHPGAGTAVRSIPHRRSTPRHTGFVCGDCHSATSRPSMPSLSSSSPAGCVACHPTRATPSPLEQDLHQAAATPPSMRARTRCTPASSRRPRPASSRAVTPLTATCRCRLTLAQITSTPRPPSTAPSSLLLVCHAAGVPTATSCGATGCHADRLQPHGFDAARHTAAPAAAAMTIAESRGHARVLRVPPSMLLTTSTATPARLPPIPRTR